MGPAEILHRPEQLAPLVDDWRRLAATTDTSYFCSPDWVLGWWESLGRGVPAQVAIWRDGSGELQAVVALARVRERLHRVVPLAVRTGANLGSGPGAADHCGWAVRPEVRDEVAAWIAGQAARGPLLLNHLDPAAGAPFVPDRAVRVAVSPCPRLAIPPDGEPTGLSTKFRKQLRAYGRKLEREGVWFRLVDGPDMTEQLLETVYRLHERRWSLIGDATSSFNRERADLHRRLIARGGSGRGPAVVLAERDGVAVGVLYGFLWRDVFAYYQTGWEPEWAAANLGTVLVSEAIRLAGTAGARVFDFLRGAEDYKYRFGATDRIDETWLVPRGAGGRLLALRYRLKGRRRGA